MSDRLAKEDYVDSAVSGISPTDANFSTSDITTNNVSSTKHGFAPKSAADATKFLNSAATPAYAQVKDSDLSTTDITTNDVTTSKHGFTPKAPNDTSKFLRGDASWAVPTKTVQLKIIDDATTLTTGDGKLIFAIPTALNGFNLTDAQGFVTTVSSSGLPTVQVRNVTDSVDMLTTKVSIDASEFTSYTAATPSVVDTAHDDVATADLLAIDVDVAGTGAKGLGVILTFSLP